MRSLKDLVRDEIVVGGFLTVLIFHGLAIYSVVVLKAPFSALDYGTGAAAVLASIGGGQGVRDWLENKGLSPEARDIKELQKEAPDAQPSDH